MGTDSKWPIPSDYSNMLQNPQIAFREPALQTCVIERDQNNQPRARAGAFANVYKGTAQTGEDVAIRVFTNASGSEQRERYSAISEYLGQLNGNCPPCLVNFNFQEKGIRVASLGGKWFPLVTMDWVPGETLFDWVRIVCHQQDRQSLGTATEKWIELASDLRRVEIAHGDLQHGNVMVTPSGELKLVDYDCMCVPKLVGRRNLEIGVEPYQHPERGADTLLFPGLDHFSELYILVALRALAESPQLWFSYNELPGQNLYDKILFRKEDFENPQHSSLYADLQRSSDDKVRKWAKELFELTRASLKDIPPLDHFVNDFDKVRQLLSAKAFDEALDLLNRRTPPPDLEAALRNAEQRVNQLKRLTDAVESGDEDAMVALYDPKLLDDYPKAKSTVDIAKKAAQAKPILDELQRLKRAHNGRELVRLWDKQANLLTGRRSAQSLRNDVDQWRKRNTAWDSIVNELKRPVPDGRAIKENWDELQQLGGHPEAQAEEPRIRRIVERAEAFERFEQVPRAVNETNDRATVEAWQESLFKGWDEAERFRQRVTAAEERLEVLQALKRAVKKHHDNLTVLGEEAIVKAGRDLPDEYAPKYQKRMQTAEGRLKARRKFEQLCKNLKTPEAELIAAWAEVEAARAESLIDTQYRDRAEQAIPRAPLLEALERISPHCHPNERDPQLLAVWDDDLLRGCRQAEPWRSAYQEACRRRDILASLSQAIAHDDDAAIVDCCESSLLAGWQFGSMEEHRIKKARDAMGQTRQLLDSLRAGQKQRFGELFSSRSLNDFAKLFAPYRQVLKDWIVSEVLPRNKNGLKLPVVGVPIRAVPGTQGIYQLRWVWPAPRFTDACLVKICRGMPRENEPPETIAALNTITVQRKAYESAACLPLPTRAGSQGGVVAIWAIIEVGTEKYYSEPLILGRLT